MSDEETNEPPILEWRLGEQTSGVLQKLLTTPYLGDSDDAYLHSRALAELVEQRDELLSACRVAAGLISATVLGFILGDPPKGASEIESKINRVIDQLNAAIRRAT